MASTRRTLLGVAVGLAGFALLALGVDALAQEKFLAKAVNIITHAGAGGGTDITTRMASLHARREFKKDIVIVNKRGGSGAVAMNYIAREPRDGYTIMTITPTRLLTIARGKAPLKIDDLVGIARATDDPQLFMVNAKSEFKTAQDFLKAAKARALKFGITNVAGSDHITTFTFAKKAGIIQPTIVPFKGDGDIVTNLVGGNVEVGVLNLAEAEAQIAAGEIRPLIVLAKKRMAPLPDVPTSVELGIDAVFSTVRGFVTLKGAPEANLATLEKGFVKGMKHKVYQAFLTSVGLTADSVVDAKEWNAQIDQLYADGEVALRELGLLK